jgi:hypothetical protein
VIGVALFREKPPCCAQAQPYTRNKMEAPAARPEAPAADAASAAPLQERLGTGHGRSEYSAAYETAFERLSDAPEEVISIWYDSRRNLVAQGVIAEPRHLARREPNPFPGGFVPDP